MTPKPKKRRARGVVAPLRVSATAHNAIAAEQVFAARLDALTAAVRACVVVGPGDLFGQFDNVDGACEAAKAAAVKLRRARNLEEPAK